MGLHLGDAESLASCSKSGGKRKVRVSPGGVTPSDEEREDKEPGTLINPVVELRKLRPRKKKPDSDLEIVDLMGAAESSSSSRMSAAAKQSSEGKTQEIR